MLISRYQRVDVEAAPAALLASLEELDGVASVTVRPDGSARIEVNAEGATGAVLRALVDGGVTSVKTSLPTLEEVYVQTIGERGLVV
jgi:ABC-2 type transport system ATP-binding protein